MTCHDGFTLYDLVSYNEKHNEANGEENRDGNNANHSWNCGSEGPTDNPEILAFRLRQAKNFMVVLFLSQGIPMLLAGDEVLRTQHGNNNSYCQDNELGWFDWTLTLANKDMLRFVQQIIAFRKRHPSLMRRRFLTGVRQEGQRLPDVSWHGARLNEPLWADPNAQMLAFTLGAFQRDEEDIHVMLNMSDSPGEFSLPQLPDRDWQQVIDTSLPPPQDIREIKTQIPIAGTMYMVSPRTVVVLESR